MALEGLVVVTRRQKFEMLRRSPSLQSSPEEPKRTAAPPLLDSFQVFANPMKLVSRLKKIEEEMSSLKDECRKLLAAKHVMRDPSGISRGSGFVAFSTPKEASRVLSEMNGKMVTSKPLYIALAQRKEERRARLQAQFSQMRPVAIPASIGVCEIGLELNSEDMNASCSYCE